MPARVPSTISVLCYLARLPQKFLRDRTIDLLLTAGSPAGATTLIISLGIITHRLYLLPCETAVALILIQALVTHRLRGIAFPLWSPKQFIAADVAHRKK